MSPEQNRDNERSTSQGSSEETVSHPKREYQQRPARDLHCPQAVVLHAVSPEIVDLVLKGLMPEIAGVASDYLYELVRDNHTLSHRRLGEIYFHTAPFAISQTQTYTLGAGDARETSHTIVIVPDTEGDTSVVELQRSVANPGAVNLSTSLACVASEKRWDWVNAIGSLLGRDDLSALFSEAPGEDIEEQHSGLCVTKLTPLISLNTISDRDNHRYVAQGSCFDDAIDQNADWVPVSIYCASPMYGEQRSMLSALCPEHYDAVIASGLLRMADNFTLNRTEVEARRLQSVSQKLPVSLVVEFKKYVEVGKFEQLEEDEWDEGSEASELGEQESDFYYEGSEGAASDQAETNLIEDGIESFEYSEADEVLDSDDSEEESVVAISGFPSRDGSFSLVYRSELELNGGETLQGGEKLSPDSQFFGVEFERVDCQLSPKDVDHRWRLVSLIGSMTGTTIDPINIQLNLEDVERSSDARRFGVDLLVDRLAVYLKK